LETAAIGFRRAIEIAATRMGLPESEPSRKFFGKQLAYAMKGRLGPSPRTTAQCRSTASQAAATTAVEVRHGGKYVAAFAATGQMADHGVVGKESRIACHELSPLFVRRVIRRRNAA
jgi:hypothetical protein